MIELQRCIVHKVRNTLKYVGEKNKKEFATDLKKIYHAPSGVRIYCLPVSAAVSSGMVQAHYQNYPRRAVSL